MTIKRSFAVLMIFLIPIVLSASLGWAGGKDIGGTYLATQSDASSILQINRDGNISMIASEQFRGGGVLGESFGNSVGTWKWTGKSEITAIMVDIAFVAGSGSFIGVAAFTNFITFSKDLKTATLTCQGAIFPPGVDPLKAGATPIAGSEFTCGEVQFNRIEP